MAGLVRYDHEEERWIKTTEGKYQLLREMALMLLSALDERDYLDPEIRRLAEKLRRALERKEVTQ